MNQIKCWMKNIHLLLEFLFICCYMCVGGGCYCEYIRLVYSLLHCAHWLVESQSNKVSLHFICRRVILHTHTYKRIQERKIIVYRLVIYKRSAWRDESRARQTVRYVYLRPYTHLDALHKRSKHPHTAAAAVYFFLKYGLPLRDAPQQNVQTSV